MYLIKNDAVKHFAAQIVCAAKYLSAFDSFVQQSVLTVIETMRHSWIFEQRCFNYIYILLINTSDMLQMLQDKHKII